MNEIKCLECGESFTSDNALVLHLKEAHGIIKIQSEDDELQKQQSSDQADYEWDSADYDEDYEYDPRTYHRSSKRMILAIFITFLLISIPIGGILLQINVSHSRFNWPTVQGRVTNVRLMTSTQDYDYVTVWFTYNLGGKTYNGKQEMAASTHEFSKYRSGYPVTVYYDPGKPENGLVNPEKSFLDSAGD